MIEMSNASYSSVIFPSLTHMCGMQRRWRGCRPQGVVCSASVERP